MYHIYVINNFFHFSVDIMYKYRVCLAAEYRAVARHKNVRVSYSLACLPTPDAPGQEDHEVGLKEYKKIYVLFLLFF